METGKKFGQSKQSLWINSLFTKACALLPHYHSGGGGRARGPRSTVRNRLVADVNPRSIDVSVLLLLLLSSSGTVDRRFVTWSYSTRLVSLSTAVVNRNRVALACVSQKSPVAAAAKIKSTA